MKMPEKGNRMSRKKRNYKSEELTEDESTTMSPNISFESEISVESQGFQQGDIKCASKILSPEERVPEGSFGSYIPQGHPSLAERLEKVEVELGSVQNELGSVKNELGNVSKKLEASEAEISLFKNHIFDLKVKDIGNSLVQFYNYRVKELIKSNLTPEEKKIYRDRDLRFENLANIFTDPSRLRLFKETAIFKKISGISSRGSIFRNLRDQRNDNIHPHNIDITEIIEDCVSLKLMF